MSGRYPKKRVQIQTTPYKDRFQVLVNKVINSPGLDDKSKKRLYFKVRTLVDQKKYMLTQQEQSQLINVYITLSKTYPTSPGTIEHVIARNFHFLNLSDCKEEYFLKIIKAWIPSVDDNNWHYIFKLFMISQMSSSPKFHAFICDSKDHFANYVIPNELLGMSSFIDNINSDIWNIFLVGIEHSKGDFNRRMYHEVFHYALKNIGMSVSSMAEPVKAELIQVLKTLMLSLKSLKDCGENSGDSDICKLFYHLTSSYYKASNVYSNSDFIYEDVLNDFFVLHFSDKIRLLFLNDEEIIKIFLPLYTFINRYILPVLKHHILESYESSLYPIGIPKNQLIARMQSQNPIPLKESLSRDKLLELEKEYIKKINDANALIKWLNNPLSNTLTDSLIVSLKKYYKLYYKKISDNTVNILISQLSEKATDKNPAEAKSFIKSILQKLNHRELTDEEITCDYVKDEFRYLYFSFLTSSYMVANKVDDVIESIQEIGKSLIPEIESDYIMGKKDLKELINAHLTQKTHQSQRCTHL